MLGFAELVKPESLSLLTILTLYPGISFKKNSPFSFYNTNVQRTMYTVQCTWQMVPMEQSTACVSARGAGSSFRQVALAHCWGLVASETTVAAKCSFHCGSFHQAADSLLRSTSSIQLF